MKKFNSFLDFHTHVVEEADRRAVTTFLKFKPMGEGCTQIGVYWIKLRKSGIYSDAVIKSYQAEWRRYSAKAVPMYQRAIVDALDDAAPKCKLTEKFKASLDL